MRNEITNTITHEKKGEKQESKELTTLLLGTTNKQKIFEKADQWRNILWAAGPYLQTEPLHKKSPHELHMKIKQYFYYPNEGDTHKIVIDTKKLQQLCDDFNRFHTHIFENENVHLYRILFRDLHQESFSTDTLEDNEKRDFQEKQQNPSDYVSRLPTQHLLKKKFMIWWEAGHKEERPNWYDKEYTKNLQKFIGNGDAAWENMLKKQLKPIFGASSVINTNKSIENTYKRFIETIHVLGMGGSDFTKDLFTYDTNNKVSVNMGKVKEINEALKLRYGVKIERFSKKG